jgi:copper chaperone NosL
MQLNQRARTAPRSETSEKTPGMTGIIPRQSVALYDRPVGGGMKKGRISAAVLGYAVFLFGLSVSCGRRAPAPEPVPVGGVNCARCSMVISREAQSAQWVVPGEETRFYDDIGCLATDSWPQAEGGARFVHADGGWAAAETVFYARPPGESTPMGYGVVAFKSREQAAARDQRGTARTWGDLVTELAAEPPGTLARPD